MTELSQPSHAKAGRRPRPYSLMHIIRRGWILSLGVPLAVAASDEPDAPRYLDASLSIDERLDDLLPRLTLDEKLSLVHANSKFSAGGIERLGLPRLWMSDGTHGVREEVGPDSWNAAGWTNDFATAMPAAIALASTWNRDLAREYGRVVAEEALKRNKHIMLGPGVNIMRTPLCGRNFEYFGEDPYLAARMVVSYIREMQAHQVAACIKHFDANNQEEMRGQINVEMSERTLREIYLPVFEAAVREAGVWCVMSAYNKFRGQYCCHNDYLLNQILKQQWGFRGLVMSDWAGVHDTRDAVFNGLDLEMGTNAPYHEFYLADPFRAGIEGGTYPVALLDEKARRVLRVLLLTGAVDERVEGSINTPEHQATARRVAEEGIVLLKNEGAFLPLDPQKLTTIAVIGDNAVTKFAAGGGAAGIKAFHEVTPLEGIVERVGTGVNVTFSQGYRHHRRNPFGPPDPAGVRPSSELTVASPEEVEAMAQWAVAAAAQADVVIFVGGLNHQRNSDAEGSDRFDLKLPAYQDALINRVIAANPRTVVALVSGAPVEMAPWIESTPAIVQAWYGGSEAGHALAAVLFGDVNPSGKLPCTFPRKLADSPAHHSGRERQYPGEDGSVHYDEGVFVGYRWFDQQQIEPLFPFGHGLSYTAFSYSNPQVLRDPQTGNVTAVQCDLSNTGDRAGAEVVQLYVSDPIASVERPPRELQGFARVSLQPGEIQTVTVPLPPRALAFFSEELNAWLVEAGTFNLEWGASSRDLRATLAIEVADTRTVP